MAECRCSYEPTLTTALCFQLIHLHKLQVDRLFKFTTPQHDFVILLIYNEIEAKLSHY